MIEDNNETSIIEDDGPLTYMEAIMSKDWQMTTCHEIQNGLHVWQLGLDLSWPTWENCPNRVQMDLQKED